MRPLKQSTASQVRTIGPFVDDTDFKTAETGLTIANTDVRLKKNGADDVAKNSGGGTHDVNGCYHLTFDATDTDTVGELFYSVKVAGALQVFGSFTVVEEAVYDRDYAASATGIVGTAQTGDSFARIGATGSGLTTLASQASLDTLDNFVDTEVADIQARLPAALVGGRIDANVGAISSDATAADNAEAFFDGTGYAGTGNVIPTVTTLTNLPAITANWLTATGIAADAITAAKIADGAIDAATFAAGAINAAAIADGAIDEATFATTAGSFHPLHIVDQGTAQSATSTTLVLRAAAAFADDELIGARILITGGSGGIGQSRLITDYVSATDTATVSAWTTTPSGTITYKIISDTAAAGGSAPTSAEVADAVWDEARSGHVGAGSFGEYVLAKDHAGANISTAASLATLATAVDTIDNFLDTEIAAIISTLGTPAGASISADLLTIDNLVDDLESRVGTPSNLGGGATLSANLADIESQTDDIGVAGAGLTAADDAVITAIAALNNLSQANIRTAVGLASANLDTQLDALPTNAELATALGTADDAVLAALVTLSAKVDTIDDFLDTEMAATLAAVDTEVATIVTAVGTTIPATLSGLFTTALTESYRSTGAAGSVSQYLHELIAHMGEKSIASTTLTLKKLDGSTSAKTYTLNDATTPTAITETT